MDKFLQTIEEYHMLEPSETVLVALSGGADSVSLLHRFAALRRERPLTLLAAHVNHGLRGEEADRDEAFCQRLCEEWEVPFFLKRVSVPGERARTGESEEECARRLRYAFLQAQAQRQGARLATAHTADDNLETILLNLVRGTGLRGLCGIPPVRGRIIRPLLFVERREVEEYCAVHGLSYVTDSTNLCNLYTRNRIRAQVTPVLKALNPSLLSVVSRMTRLLGAEESLLQEQAREGLAAARREDGLDAAVLLRLPAPLRYRALAMAAGEAGGSLASVHVPMLEGILKKGGSTDLPGAVRMTVRRGRLSVQKKEDGGFAGLPETPLAVPGRTTAGKCCIQVRKIEGNGQNIYNFLFNNALDYAKIKGTLRVRSRRPGDKLSLPRRNGSKTLKKLFQESAVSVQQRDNIPVVADEEGVVWVAGFGCDRRVMATKETVSLLLLDVREEDGL